MGLPLKVIKPDGEEPCEPYLLRAGGWTEDRYFKEAPETQIVEFEDEEIIMHSPASMRHQDITGFLIFLLRGYVRFQDMGRALNGPAVVRLRPGLDLEPDIFFIAKGQLDRLGDQYFSGAPALVIEVISTGSRNHDLKTKAAHYREHGVKEYWAIDAEQRTLYRHLLPDRPHDPYRVSKHTEGRLESRAIAGFWIEVGWFWQEPLPAELECLQQILGT